jgi:hypothetical protein
MMVLDLTEEEAGAIDNRKFRAIREYLATLDMKDQGFSDQEIERLKRQNSKNRVDQMIAASQQQVQ